jgi:hypothetical protein
MSTIGGAPSTRPKGEVAARRMVAVAQDERGGAGLRRACSTSADALVRKAGDDTTRGVAKWGAYKSVARDGFARPPTRNPSSGHEIDCIRRNDYFSQRANFTALMRATARDAMRTPTPGTAPGWSADNLLTEISRLLDGMLRRPRRPGRRAAPRDTVASEPLRASPCEPQPGSVALYNSADLRQARSTKPRPTGAFHCERAPRATIACRPADFAPGGQTGLERYHGTVGQERPS